MKIVLSMEYLITALWSSSSKSTNGLSNRVLKGRLSMSGLSIHCGPSQPLSTISTCLKISE